MKIKYWFTGFLQIVSFIVLMPIFCIIFDIKLRKLGPLRFKGATIYASGHRTWIDPPLIGILIPRAVALVAKAELFKNPAMGLLIRSLGAFPVNRALFDMKSFAMMFRVLDEGRGLVIFPEGTRNRENTVRDGKPGIGYLLKKRAGTVVVPIRVFTGRGGLLGRRYFRVIFGRAFCVNANMFDHIEEKASYKRMAMVVTDNIRRLEWD